MLALKPYLTAQEAEEIDKLLDVPVWCPHSPFGRQKLFLHDLHDAREAFYGGAAGGMKSDALLQAALEYVDVPGYAALLLRRTYADLSKPGALMHRAQEWLYDSPARWNGQDHQWRFPSGSVLQFGYLETESDKLKYQSSEFQFIGFDEVTQFAESQYTYLFSRLRRPGVPCEKCSQVLRRDGGAWIHDEEQKVIDCSSPVPAARVIAQYKPSANGLSVFDIPLRMRSASNPAEDHTGYWVAERFVPDDFTPDDANEPRIFWKAGKDAHGEVVQRPFVPSRMEDNPFLDQKAYDLSLGELDEVTYEQLKKVTGRLSARAISSQCGEKIITLFLGLNLPLSSVCAISLTIGPVGFLRIGARRNHTLALLRYLQLRLLTLPLLAVFLSLGD